MQRRKKNLLISSSDGTNSNGTPVVTPDSVLSYVDTNDEELKVHSSLAVGTIGIKVNSIWSHELLGIALPLRHLYDHVPISPDLIRRWIESTDEKIGGLCFPGKLLDIESKDPRFIIFKNRAQPSTAKSDSVLVNIRIHIFRRDIDPSPELQPFDPAVWHPNAREAWEYSHARLAPIFEEVISPVPL
jgi:hypothetical protein